MATITGGCLCGAVRYRTEAAPLFAGVCHCTDCQRTSGSAFACEVGVPKDGLVVTGEVRVFSNKGDSGGGVHRGFCPTCGATLLVEVDAMPGAVLLTMGTMDDKTIIAPQMHLYCASAQPWVALPQDIPTFPKMPPLG